MGKVINRIYKYNQRICTYQYPSTTFIITPYSDNFIQTQHNNDSDDSVYANNVASAGLYQRTNRHSNMDVKDNDDSQSFETHRKIISVLSLLVTQ